MKIFTRRNKIAILIVGLSPFTAMLNVWLAFAQLLLGMGLMIYTMYG